MTGWHRPDVVASAREHLAQAVGPVSAQQMVDGLIAKGRAEVTDALELGDLAGRVSASCPTLGHPTWLRARSDARGCPWCRVAELDAQAAVVAEFVAARAEYITAIRNCHPDNAHDYHRWQGHAEFIAAARTDVPALLTEVERLRSERDEFANRVDTLTKVAKGNKQHVQVLLGELEQQATAATGPREGDRAHIAALETFADLATEYRVPIEGDPGAWLLVRREPTGDRWAILTSHRVSGKRRAWVGGRWQTMPVVGPVGLWEYTTAEAAICQATALAKDAEDGEPRG